VADSAGKRRVEGQRKERRLAKEGRKAERIHDRPGDGQPIDEAALMDRFQQISERHGQGLMDGAAYEVEKREIFLALGLDTLD